MIENLSDEERVERIAGHIGEIISLIGEDGTREGLVKTPMRAAKHCGLSHPAIVRRPRI